MNFANKTKGWYSHPGPFISHSTSPVGLHSQNGSEHPSPHVSPTLNQMSPRSQPYTSFCRLPLFSSAEAKMENHQCNKTEMFFTARKRSCLKEMFLHLAVILFIGGISVQWEGCLCPGRFLSRSGVSVQEWGPCPRVGSLSRSGVSCKSRVSVQEWGLCPGGSLSRGVSVQGGVSFRKTRPPPRLVKSRQYASYCDALYNVSIWCNVIDYWLFFKSWKIWEKGTDISV